SPSVDLTIVETDGGSPFPVRLITLSDFTARSDPDVLDSTAAQSPREVPFGGDRGRRAIGPVVGHGDVPTSDELTEEVEFVSKLLIGSTGQKHIIGRHAYSFANTPDRVE